VIIPGGDVRLKERLREYLEKTGTEITSSGFMRCPFHDDASPSMKLYEDHGFCFVCQTGVDIYDFAAWRLGLPCDKAHFPQIAREVEAVLGIAPEWKPSADERRTYYRKNRDMAGKRMPPLSKSAVYREGLLREMTEAVDMGNMERAVISAELLLALFMLPEEAGPEEKRLTGEEKERARMMEGLART
jgi:hypothetical protein